MLVFDLNAKNLGFQPKSTWQQYLDKVSGMFSGVGFF